MAGQVTNYACPACGGPLHFDQATQKVVCDYCDSSFDIKYIEDFYAEKDEQAASAKLEAEEKLENGQQEAGDSWELQSTDDWGDDQDKVRVYGCPSCGAELVLDDTTGAGSCPYCGNPTIIPGVFEGMLKPDYVIPFSVTKDQAEDALKKFYKKKPFLPNAFSSSNHIKEIQGIYVPFWLYSGEADAQVRFHATRSYTRSTPRENITTTEHFDVYRSGSVAFDKIPADGSSKMPDDYMDSIEPYDYSKLTPFSTAYLPGFAADKYDVTAQDCEIRAGNRARNSAIDAMRNDVIGYSSVSVTNASVNLRSGKTEYALLPVWVLHTKYNNEDFLFTVNGQTGKMAGKLPVSKGKMLGWFAGIFAGAGALLTLLFTMMG